jgi:hypothetical protein
MGKASKRPGRVARDVHDRIRAEAEALSRAPRFGVREPDGLPGVAGLLTAAREAVEAAMPSAFDYEGRRYFLRARLAIQVDVFDTPGAGSPLVSGATFSDEGFGHVPGH